MTIKEANLEVFWRVYETLKPKDRQVLAERILEDRKLLEGLFDHMLIEKVKKVKGKPITLAEYAACRQRAAG